MNSKNVPHIQESRQDSNIVIMGLGALGKRHLSSILNSKLPLNVYCFDINPNALDGFSWEDIYNNKVLHREESLEHLPHDIDFALFSMTSSGRREMFDKLVDCTCVRNILFEKFLFQKMDDYDEVECTLRKKDIKAWVNCSRRQMDSYQFLRDELKISKELHFCISGGEWGLACNAIHMMDLISFLSGTDEIVLDEFTGLLPCIYESKRAGYKEVFGTISGRCGKHTSFSLNCMKDAGTPVVIFISSDVGQFYIIEGRQTIISMKQENNYAIKEEPFAFPYQSQMTQYVMEDILKNGQSRLSTFEESAKLHKVFLSSLLVFFNKNGLEGDTCPIT